MASARPKKTNQVRKHKRPPGLTVAQVEEALRLSGGIRAYAAQRLSVNRSTITRFMAKHPELVEVEQEIVDTLLDRAEAKLFKKIDQECESSIHFFLRERGKERGYGRRHYEHSGVGGGPIQYRDVSDLTDEQLHILEQAAVALAGGTEGSREQPEPDAR